jgi:MoaA/NifB/PqqE/SkfB family radical SAM enzyme
LKVRDSLSRKNKIDIIKQLGKAGVWFVSLCGGEPLLDRDLEYLIKEAKRQNIGINISTNGSLLEEKAEILIKSGVNSIIVSMESYKAEIHDRIRGHPGLFEKAKRGIEIMREKRHKRPLISLRILINKETYPDLDEYVRFWKDRVDEILLQPIHENPRTLLRIPDHMRFLKEDKGRFIQYYFRILNKYRFLDTLYNREIPTYIFDEETLIKKYNCFAGFFFGDIDPQGDIYSCGEHQRKLGNLTQQSLLNIWNFRETDEFRKSIRKNRKCSCWLNHTLLNIYLSKLFGRRVHKR